MKNNLLAHPSVEAWKTGSPRQWWAFEQLDDNDGLRDRVLLAVLNGRWEDEAVDELESFTDALEAHTRAFRAGSMRPPPEPGERRSFPVNATRMTPMCRADVRFFRIDFSSPEGWGGYFETTNPGVVERISKLRNHAKTLTLVGEVSRRPYEFYVELTGDVRIV